MGQKEQLSLTVMMGLPKNLPCFSKANVKDLALKNLLKNSAIQDNITISYFINSKTEALPHSIVKNGDRKQSHDELGRLSGKSSATDSSIPKPPSMLSLRNLSNLVSPSVSVASNGSLPNTAYKKKLHLFHPQNPKQTIETHRTKEKFRQEIADPISIERNVRQLLCDKVSGNLVGTWLLIPEHLKLGTWDLLCGWTGKTRSQVHPRLAMQLVNEAALCITGARQERTLSQKGFEVANGLHFVATDTAIHHLLNEHTVKEAQRLQIALAKIRSTFGDFDGSLLAIDPHRIISYTKRQTPRRKKDPHSPAKKTAQTFFCLDAVTEQPLCFVSGTSARSVTHASLELLELTTQILNPKVGQALVLADTEHYTLNLLDSIRLQTLFDLLVPMPNNPKLKKQILGLSNEAFTRHWAGYSTTKLPYKMKGTKTGPFYQFIQREGERPDDCEFKAFLCTNDRNQVKALCKDFPERWHIEEFFKNYQALGWNRAGTMNLNIQYGRMTLALIAQAALYHMRKKIGSPFAKWDAHHLANDFIRGLEGDVRVKYDTIIVTLYNPPNPDLLKKHYENLPEKLIANNTNPKVPWLYDFKLDFRIK